MTYPELVDRIGQGRPVAFSRWGDGEWSAILGRPGANCDGQAYTPSLRTALGDVLRRRPTYSLGIQRLARRRMGADIDAWLAQEGLSDLPWTEAGILHTASINAALEPFLEALRARPPILVGPARLARLESRFPLVDHVVIPDTAAWDVRAQLLREGVEALDCHPGAPVIVSAGMGANVLIDHWVTTHPDRCLIDTGSLWDPYVGVATRRYHAKLIEQLRGSA